MLTAQSSSRRGDAFDRESLAGIQPRATIGIVSGLYELFPSNEPVLNSLRGLADAIEPGGYLIYTNQPWHPQLEFIAHVLVNREGERWIMRRRTTAEMDELVRVAGFEKIDMEIDQWGMFTVSIARREALNEARRSSSPRGLSVVVSGRLQRLQLDHGDNAANVGTFLFSMGAWHPIRSFHDSPLHVDRSLLHCGSVPVSNRARVVGFFRGGSSPQFSSQGFVFCFSRCVLLFRALTLAAGSARSSIGFAEWTCHTICFPSLHAALLLILLDIYFRNTSRRFVRIGVMSWFVLIACRQFLLISITSSTSSVVLSWPDIASTFFASLHTRSQLSRIAASVRITQRERRLS